MKQKMICTLAALIVAASITGCSSASSSVSSSSSSSSLAGSSVSSSVSSSVESSVSSEASSNTANEGDIAISDIHEAVKAAYGENYVPSMAIEEQQLTEVYGINTENIEDFIMEAPMISAHIDTFAAIKAKEGKGEEVENEMNAYRDMLINDTLQYPSNIAKLNASRVIRHGDYVFFVMLGAFNENRDATEDEQAKFAEEQVQIGVDAIESFFNK